MKSKDPIGERMKGNYEDRSRFYLTRRTPVIIRVDGRAFHTLTKDAEKPFDVDFMLAMQEAAWALCEDIQGCKLAYIQSDEISLLLTDYDTLTTEAWFDYNIQKMCSVAASVATTAFNDTFFCLKNAKRANFDARCFNIPKEEVCNYFIWRQQDATRNSIQLLAQANFPHKELQNLNCNQLQDKLVLEKGTNWNDLQDFKKRGSCITREVYVGLSVGGILIDMNTKELLPDLSGMEVSTVLKQDRWKLTNSPPIFTQNREYIERFVRVGE